MNHTNFFKHLLCAVFIIISASSCSKSSLSKYIYCERNSITRQNIIHSNSSCSKIRYGYKLKLTSYYKYTEGFDVFCPDCCYESDVIKITKGENLQ